MATNKPTALITGVGGQDGSYLAELLLDKGYEVYGTVRNFNHLRRMSRLASLRDRIEIIHCNGMDPVRVNEIVTAIQPRELYNLAAESHVGTSFSQPHLYLQSDATAVVNYLEAVRRHSPRTRFYQASSSEMFGNASWPQSERTQFQPASPYAAAKAYAHHMVAHYRIAYGLHLSSGICFNHESERRGLQFVTRKITYNLARIKAGIQSGRLKLGPLTPLRDWGYAPEYVHGMWKMLQLDTPRDMVLATGRTYTVREFLNEVLDISGLAFNDVIEYDPGLERPHEVTRLQGDTELARRLIDWDPQMTLNQIAFQMWKSDFALAQRS